MKELFVPYNLAFKLKEIGFDEPCLASYYTDVSENNINAPGGKRDYRKKFNGLEYHPLDSDGVEWEPNFIRNTDKTYYISAPTFDQIFKWFRKKYNLISTIAIHTTSTNKKFYYFEIYSQDIVINITLDNDSSSYFYPGSRYNSFEKAQLKCLEKLIEIIEIYNRWEELRDSGLDEPLGSFE